MSKLPTLSTVQSPPDKSTRLGNQSSEYQDAEKNYQPKSLKFWTVMLGMYFSIFLVALDRMIIAVAIPAISNEFHSIGDIGWYGSAYMLTAAGFNPVFGRIYQLYSTKWTFLTSIAIFETGSTLCGAAPSSIVFIIGRAIAGLGSAGVMSGGMMIILPLIPLRKRPTYTAFFGMLFGIASVLGPIVGGAFTDHVTWRWCFYINLPIGGFTVLAMLFFLDVEPPKRGKLTFLEQIQKLDPVGVLCFFPSMVCLILALQWGGITYTWSNPKIIGLLVTFAILFVAFVVVEALTPNTAMAPTRIVLNRSVAASMFFCFLISGAMLSIVYFISIWFQAVKGDSATLAGISTIPLVIAMVIFGFIMANFTERVGYYVPGMLLAPILCAVGAGMLSTMTHFSNHSQWIGYQTLFGLGLGSGFQQANLAAQTVLPRADVPIGMALFFFMQQLGGSVFLSVGQNILSTKLVERLIGIDGLDPATIVNTGATAIRAIVPPARLDAVFDAYNYAITRIFLMSAIISAVMILCAAATEWKSIKGARSMVNTPKSAEVMAEEGEHKGKI